MNIEPNKSDLESRGRVSTSSWTSSHVRVRKPRVGSEMSKNEEDHHVTRDCKASKNKRERCARSGKRDGDIVNADWRGCGRRDSKRA